MDVSHYPPEQQERLKFVVGLSESEDPKDRLLFELLSRLVEQENQIAHMQMAFDDVCEQLLESGHIVDRD